MIKLINRQKISVMAVCFTLPFLLCSCQDDAASENAVSVFVIEDIDTYDSAADEKQEEKDIPKDITSEIKQYQADKLFKIYEDKLAIEAGAKALVYECLCNTEFVSLPLKEKYDFSGFVIDKVTGNPVISEAAKAAIKAKKENKSVADILSESAEGAISALPSYFESEAEGTISDFLGVDVFAVADFISEWNNADSVPRVLINEIAKDQEKEVAKLSLFLDLAEIRPEDICSIAQTSYSVSKRNAMIRKALGFEDKNKIDYYEKLISLAKEDAYLSGEAVFYGAINTEDSIYELTEEETANIAKEREAFAEQLDDFYLELADIKAGHICTNYDIEGFEKSQENTSRQGLLGGVFGDWFGGIISDNTQKLEDDIQLSRAKEYAEVPKDSVESYNELAGLQIQYWKSISVFEKSKSCDGLDIYFNQEYTEAENDNICGKALEYAEYLDRYMFDLSTMEKMYRCLLSNNQASFLTDIEREKNMLEECLIHFETKDILGYSSEEKSERYLRSLNRYIENINFVQLHAGSQGYTPAFTAGAEKRIYGDGNYVSYVNGDKVIMIVVLGTGDTLYGGKGWHYYYDMNGNVIYISYGNEKIALLDNEVVWYQLSNEANLGVYVEMAKQSFDLFM